MLQVKIVAVGKIREKFIQDGIREYVKRLGPYIKLSIIEVADESCPDRPIAAEEDRVKHREGERILRMLGPQDYVILLDLAGKQHTSEKMAAFIAELTLGGKSSLAFVTGGSIGVSPSVRERADFRWSFSNLTFPHALIRLMLLEQLYRCMKICAGEPYHK